jgi:hypothetical protein
VTLTALALIPSVAHVLALPDKTGLPEGSYFVVYHGQAPLGVVLICALIADAVLAMLVRDRPMPLWLAVLGFIAIAATLALFLHPLTENWIAAPQSWESLQRQWQYSHAVNAILTFVGLCAVTCSVLSASK